MFVEHCYVHRPGEGLSISFLLLLSASSFLCAVFKVRPGLRFRFDRASSFFGLPLNVFALALPCIFALVLRLTPGGLKWTRTTDLTLIRRVL